ncbi:MAG: 16S rRNA (uracil(1498)-N(3))-methyltransferase, partial [Nitrospirae bacterium]
MDETHQRIILPELNPEDEEIRVSNEEFHYLKNVLRLRPAQRVIVLDGRGLELQTIIKEVKKKTLTLKVLKRKKHAPPRRGRLILIQAVLKADRMDLVVQKTTELGVDVIVPVFTENTVLKNTKKLQHWRRVCLEATRQSRRLFMPEIKEPCPLRKALQEA